MKKKKWIWTVCIVAFLCAGGILAVSMGSQGTEAEISPEVSYIELCTAMDLDGTYKSIEFSANQDGQVNIWFENQGVEAVNIELVKKEGLFKKEERTPPMVVPSNMADGSYFKTHVEKGETYFVIAYTELGNPINGRLKVKPILSYE